MCILISVHGRRWKKLRQSKRQVKASQGNIRIVCAFFSLSSRFRLSLYLREMWMSHLGTWFSGGRLSSVRLYGWRS